MSVNPSTVLRKERPVCPVCKQCFTISDSGLFNHRAKCPMILGCGHTVCTMCLRLSARHKQRLCCSTCKQLTDLPDENSYKSLPFNYHVMGSVFANASLDIDTRFNVIFKRSIPPAPGTSSSLSASKTDICSTCAKKRIDVTCLDCILSFCQECYAELHEENEAMLEHRPLYIVPVSKKQSSQLCAEHDAAKVYFCNTDNMLVCPHCTATGPHNGHSVIPIREKNKTFEEEVKTAVEAASGVGRCLAHSGKTLKKLTNAVDARTRAATADIHKEFCNLHAILELREHELIKEVQLGTEEKTKFINQAIQTMKTNQRRLKALISDSKERLSSNSEILDPEWLKQVAEVRELPCFVDIPEEEMSRRVDDMISKPEVDSSFLSAHSFITRTPSSTTRSFSIFEIAKIQDVAADVLEAFSEDDEADLEDVIDDFSSMPELESLSVQSSEPDDAVLQEDAKSECSKVSICENGAKPKNDPLQAVMYLGVKPRNWAPLKTETVRVVYTVSPTHFYVQRSVDIAACSELNKCIRTWCRNSNKENTAVDSVEAGDLCLAYSKDYKCYYRARITEVLYQARGGTTGQRFKVKVAFIDYGNSEFAYEDRLRKIPAEFSAIPGLAVKCSLAEIDPVDKQSGWSKAAIKLFLKFTKNAMVTMTVCELVGDTLYVDIGGGGGAAPSKTPCSVRDSLVFMGQGFISRKPYVPDDSSKVLPSSDAADGKYGDPELPPKGAALTVLVSHINTPEQFYVQLAKSGRDIPHILEELKGKYGRKGSQADTQLREPCQGMPCAAQYQDGRWYRAEVLDARDDGKVEVFYVDFGNAEVVDRARVKRLLPRFLAWPKMAIQCGLTHVRPLPAVSSGEDTDGEERKEWSEETKIYFHGQVADRLMRAKVDEILENKLLISLYTSDEQGVCLNAELVVRGFADKCTTGSAEKDVPKAAERDERAPPAAAAQGEEAEAGEPKTTLIVRLSHIVSPDEMYAQLVGSCPDLELMSKNLQGVYKNTEPVDNPWSCNDLCAVLDPETKSWCRGRIEALCGANAAEVFRVDYGNSLTVTMDRLRVLLEDFLLNPGFAFRCHLVGILAPGGGDKWPFVAIECLKELAARFKPVYMKRMGKPDNGMPVHAFGKEVKKPEALEPIKETCVSFTEELIERGLALPTRRSRVNPVTTADLGEESLPAVASLGDFNFEALAAAESSASLVSLTSAETAGGSDSASALLGHREVNAVERQWNPPQPRLRVGQKFTAVPTHVTYAGEVCLHDKTKNGPTLDYISFSLKSKYEGTQPQSHDLYWYENQMCISQFEMDGGWYRARVISVDAGMVTVHFVDYGNEETVHPGQLRKEVILDNVAQQGFCCDLHGIAPASEDGVWSKKALDFLHVLICEKPCEAVVMALPEGENPKISLSLIADEKVENTMVEMGYAVRAKVEVEVEGEQEEELDAYVVEEEPMEEELAAFKDLDPVPVGESFNIAVCEILGPNAFYVQRAKSVEGDPGEYQAEIDRHCDDLLRYSEWMNAEADGWPAVILVRPGLPCCARYADGSWFRALVVDVLPQDEEVTVFYVDYGNMEQLTVDRLRALPCELLELPRQAIECQLHQVEPVDEWSEEIEDRFKSIYEGEQALLAVVKSCGSPVRVDLLVLGEAGDKMELAYQSLIDSNLIKLVIDRKESL